jgi:hypothetical protein
MIVRLYLYTAGDGSPPVGGSPSYNMCFREIVQVFFLEGSLLTWTFLSPLSALSRHSELRSQEKYVFKNILKIKNIILKKWKLRHSEHSGRLFTQLVREKIAISESLAETQPRLSDFRGLKAFKKSGHHFLTPYCIRAPLFNPFLYLGTTFWRIWLYF